MPTYEYRCNACKREFEYEQRMSDDDLVTCEVCGEPKLEKLISRTAFQLKGGGWYKDLYASPGAPKPAEKAGDGAAKSPATDAAGGKADSSSPSSSPSPSPSPSSSSDSSSSSSSTPTTSSPASSSGSSKD